MFNKFPKRTGVYHIRDNIEKLELRLYFRHINSLLKLPKFDYNKNVNNNWHESEQLDGGNGTNAEDAVRIINIKWQEKLFSAAERAKYADEKNCLTETEKKYHKWLLQRTQAEQGETDFERRSSGQRRKKKRSRKQEKLAKLPTTPLDHDEIHTYVNDDNFKPKHHKKNISPNPKEAAIVYMYIYAALYTDTQLIQLQWYPQQRMLHIYPDFNNFAHNPYFVEIDTDYRHLYAYAIENISKARPLQPNVDLQLYLQLPELKPHWRLEDEARASIFAMPPKRTKRVSLLLDLRLAYGFEYNNIHVRYHVHLPPNTIHEEGLLDACTHSSSMSASGVHHFGYNWQLTLLCEEDYNPADFLHIYFELISLDSWQRERCEGYAHYATSLLNPSGIEQQNLQCLRPVETFRSWLERYFIGGRRKFDFIRFFSGQQKQEGEDQQTLFHNRYGNSMLSTGKLEFTCQRFLQRNCELLEPCASRTTGMTLDDIMFAYREARKRLESLVLT